MNKINYRLFLASVALFLAFASFTTACAQGETNVTIHQTDEGVILKEETAADTPRYSNNPYIEVHAGKLGSFFDWSLEDKALYSAWMKEQGLEQERVVHGLPCEDNMPVEDVVAQARKAVLDKYDVKATVLDEKFRIRMTFNVIDPQSPLWEIEFRPIEGEDINDIGYYNVTILDSTGEVFRIYNVDDSQG